MSELQPSASPATQFIIMSRAFEHATKGLSKAENTPAIKACLAVKVLAIVASGESDAVRLSKAALATMRQCLLACEGCQPRGSQPLRS
jgi:hypothetical protein